MCAYSACPTGLKGCQKEEVSNGGGAGEVSDKEGKPYTALTYGRRALEEDVVVDRKQERSSHNVEVMLKEDG